MAAAATAAAAAAATRAPVLATAAATLATTAVAAATGVRQRHVTAEAANHSSARRLRMYASVMTRITMSMRIQQNQAKIKTCPWGSALSRCAHVQKQQVR